jgi:predicted metal-dependent enzyme (double-stranded beta helix superfamily)
MLSIRDFAAAVNGLVDRPEPDWAGVSAGLAELMRDLVRRPDLLTLGVPREGNHVRESQYLYWDGELSITISHQARGITIPAHDHGVWEAVSVYRGQINHTLYGGIDPAADPTDTGLTTLDERTMGPGDTIVVVPPDDIHTFTALAEDTYHIAIVGGRYKPVRNYFQPDQRSFVARSETTWRRR